MSPSLTYNGEGSIAQVKALLKGPSESDTAGPRIEPQPFQLKSNPSTNCATPTPTFCLMKVIVQQRLWVFFFVCTLCKRVFIFLF